MCGEIKYCQIGTERPQRAIRGTQLQTETLELLRDTDVDHGADAIGVALDQEELLAHLRSRKVTPDLGRLQTGADGVVFEDGILTSIGADNVWN